MDTDDVNNYVLPVYGTGLNVDVDSTLATIDATAITGTVALDISQHDTRIRKEIANSLLQHYCPYRMTVEGIDALKQAAYAYGDSPGTDVKLLFDNTCKKCIHCPLEDCGLDSPNYITSFDNTPMPF